MTGTELGIVMIVVIFVALASLFVSKVDLPRKDDHQDDDWVDVWWE